MAYEHDLWHHKEWKAIEIVPGCRPDFSAQWQKKWCGTVDVRFIENPSNADYIRWQMTYVKKQLDL